MNWSPAALVVGDEVEDPLDRVFGQKCFLVEVDDPVVRLQKVVLVFQAELKNNDHSKL